jgi:photosystem II stability/assembly factor-like uncharacterized protein
MTNTWQPHGAIAAGGTILGIAASPTGIWLATEAGIWGSVAGAWRPAEEAAPLPQTVALACAGPAIFVGGAPFGIAYSVDDGHSWRTTWIDQADRPVTCFAVSPRFAHDGVLLAGTAGAGILRSTDGGRRWRLANFGLHEFDILALVAAPDWGEREIAFAATIGGVYRSPNGGRAWKRIAALDGAPIQALAVSPRFAEDRTVYAAGEEAALFRSTDAGRTWQALAGDGPAAFNSLWLHPDDPALLVAGTPDGELYRSTDAASSWARIAEGLNPVLVLTGDAETLYAGLYEDGLLVAHQGGTAWQLDISIAARDITRLVIADTPTTSLQAYGPTGGVWRAVGAEWQRLGSFPFDGLVTSVVGVGPRQLLVAGDGGLFRSGDDGAGWELALSPDDAQITILVPGLVPGEVWAGGADGSLWRSSDDGRSWSHATTIAAGLPVVALAPAPAGALVAATYDTSAARITIWHSAGAGRGWARWLEDVAGGPRVQIIEQRTENKEQNLYGGPSVAAFAESQAPSLGVLIAAGTSVWRWHEGQWQPTAIDGRGLAALLRLPGDAGFVAATTGGVYRSADGTAWSPLGDAAPRGLVDLAFIDDRRLLGLARGGMLWSLDLVSMNDER